MIVDVHGHITSPALFGRFPMPPSLMDIEGMIEQKAAAGISLTIVGSPVGAGTMVRVPGLDNYRQPGDQLRQFHDWIAEQVRHWPASLRAYAYVNPFGGDKALAAAAALLEQPEFVGLIANSSVSGEYLDSPRADGFFAMAAGHHAPVLLHPPAEPAGGPKLRDPRLVEHVARPCDVATGTAAIIFAGWLEKYQDLAIIAPLAAGGLPLLAEKLEAAARMPRQLGPAPIPEGEPVLAGPVSESLARVYADTATPSADALRAAVRVLGPRNLLFGTDSPPLGEPLAQVLGRLERLGLPAAERELITGTTAAALFGLDHTNADTPIRAGATAGEESR
ncbi:MAG TPA: amidohydrolase family protein [Streptosporangiaceae bacterium]|jgi:aminocarboxymuconate-semialdehyde decarboxylase